MYRVRLSCRIAAGRRRGGGGGGGDIEWMQVTKGVVEHMRLNSLYQALLC